MKALLLSAAAAAALAGVACLLSVEPLVARPSPRAHPGGQLLASLPAAFVPNLGQWQHDARYVAQRGATTMLLHGSGWTLAQVAGARGVAVRMTFAGASDAQPAGEDPLPGRHHYFLGKDPARWRSDVPLYGAVRYRAMYPGIDVLAREQDGHFEYDLLLAPGAALELVELVVEGVEGVRFERETLVLETALGPLHLTPPKTWEEGPHGERAPLRCCHVLRGRDRLGFAVPGRRPGFALVVDPGLRWSTFCGGTRTEVARAVALEPQGDTVLAGHTDSPDFPVTPGAFDPTLDGRWDAFVTRLSAAGSSLVYSTYLGGGSSAGDYATALAVDHQGAATVAGYTGAPDFPTTPGALDPTPNGRLDAFVTRLSPTGSSLVYSTHLGGARDDYAYAIALDSQGAATIAGTTTSTDFPATPAAFDTTHNGGVDAFVARLAPSGSSLVYATYLGGALADAAYAVALDAQGTAAVAGDTVSPDLPMTPGAFDPSHNGGRDAFVSLLAPSGSSLLYSTYLGGQSHDLAFAVALDVQGTVTIAGHTQSSAYPTTAGAFDTTYNGGVIGDYDAFVTRLATATGLVFSTFLGGASHERATAIAVDAEGATVVAGSTSSPDFPTTAGAFDTTPGGGAASSDAFVARLAASGTALRYSTFLGGTLTDDGHALALDARGEATVAGSTAAVDFPATPGAFDPTYNGGPGDAFVARLDLLPTGVAAYGSSSPGCSGPLAMSVTSWPQIGNAAFAATCGHAPPSASGWLLLAAGRLTTPLTVLGAQVWVDPASAWAAAVPAQSDASGAASVPLPIPRNLWLAGQTFHAQLVWIGPTSPPPCPPLGVSSSSALVIAIQP